MTPQAPGGLSLGVSSDGRMTINGSRQRLHVSLKVVDMLTVNVDMALFISCLRKRDRMKISP